MGGVPKPLAACLAPSLLRWRSELGSCGGAMEGGRVLGRFALRSPISARAGSRWAWNVCIAKNREVLVRSVLNSREKVQRETERGLT